MRGSRFNKRKDPQIFSDNYDYIFKVVLTGDDPEGKSYLVRKFSKNYYETNYKSTVGVNLHENTLSV